MLGPQNLRRTLRPRPGGLRSRGSNFAIEDKGIVIITADKSIIFVFRQTNFFFSCQIHSQLSARLSRRLPALAEIDWAIDPLDLHAPGVPQLVAGDRDGQVPGRREGVVACQM